VLKQESYGYLYTIISMSDNGILDILDGMDGFWEAYNSTNKDC
jgi:hypothetical protein